MPMDRMEHSLLVMYFSMMMLIIILLTFTQVGTLHLLMTNGAEWVGENKPQGNHNKDTYRYNKGQMYTSLKNPFCE